ncbi:hypothetical protein [Flavobacterium sp.]|uniref:hypothetical protein n=1 Tax=Flavobacterium sp. TaxID=239 RepID=UPI003D0BAC84
MKNLWCWRCKMEVPMLDEEEYKVASQLYRDGFEKGKCNMTRKKRFKDLLDYYKDLTGFETTNPNAIMYHRIALYGPVCENCAKPYRTPKASFCAACGHKREATLVSHIETSEKAAIKWWQKLLVLNRAD